MRPIQRQNLRRGVAYEAEYESWMQGRLNLAVDLSDWLDPGRTNQHCHSYRRGN